MLVLIQVTFALTLVSFVVICVLDIKKKYFNDKH